MASNDMGFNFVDWAVVEKERREDKPSGKPTLRFVQPTITIASTLKK